MKPKISEHQLFFKLNLAQRVVVKRVDREMTESVGATATQIAAILYLTENDGCLLVDLARELLQNKSAITTLVERMIRNGLLVKKPSSNDGRAFQLFLTKKGREVGNAALPHVIRYDNELIGDFSIKEIEIIHRFLDRIMDHFDIPGDNFFKRKMQEL